MTARDQLLARLAKLNIDRSRGPARKDSPVFQCKNPSTCFRFCQWTLFSAGS